MKGKDIKHGLKRFAPRPEAGFRVDVNEGVEYPFFLWRGKKHYFIHPVRKEMDLTDDVVLAMYADVKGNFSQAKSAYFVEAASETVVDVPPVETQGKKSIRNTEGL